MAENAILSQREIDALLNQEMGVELAAPTAVNSPSRREPARKVNTYDFRHPEKLSKEQIRGLQIIQQSVAGSLAQAFSSRLRAPVVARLSALERGIYEEYMLQVGTAAVVIVIDMSPLQGYAVASFGLDVAFGIVDRLLGGRGRKPAKAIARDLTDIETALLRHVGLDIARSLVEPWARVTELIPDVTELATGPHVLHAIPPSEFVITAWYEVQFGEQTGGISLCFPLTVLEQILPRLTGQSLFENLSGREPSPDQTVNDEQLLPMTIGVRALLGGARIPALDIAHLQEGDVIVLDREVEDPLHILVGNCDRFAGVAGTRGKRLALQVTAAVDDDGWLQPFEEAS